jgi:hypothetical protein
MKKPQFAERQYEAAAHIELARGRASPFVPTQSIEWYLGIDAAADPVKAHAIWRILSVSIPRRIYLSPALWPALPPQFHDDIPGRFCSLFMQFKRPVYQDNARAKRHSVFGGPYYEVGITSHQQKALLQLENRVRRRAVVRYASPAFWSRAEFDRHDEQRQVLANSAFISPTRVKKHKKWMYVGSAGKVVLNPEPEEIEADNWEIVLRQLAEQAEQQSLRTHVRDLAAALGEESERLNQIAESPWLQRIAKYGQFSTEDNLLLFDLSVVAGAAEAANSSWVVLLLPEEDWQDLFADDRTWMWRWPRWWW